MKENIYTKINNICLVILTTIAITIALIYTRSVLIPFVIALFVYFVLSPGIKWIHIKLKLPRAVSLILIIIGILIISALILFFIFNSIENFISSSAVYRHNVIQFVNWLSNITSKYGISINVQYIKKYLTDLPIFRLAGNLTGGILSFLGNTVLVFIFLFFLIVGEVKGIAVHPVIAEIQKTISRYITIKFFISLLTGILVWLVLIVAGVPLAFMFGVLTLLLNFIPNIGSLIAVLLPLPVVILQFGTGWELISILGLISIIQFSIGNILEPKIMGENMDIHPVFVLLFLVFWGLVWGITGMFLAVPITAVLNIILSKIETTKPVSRIIAGQFPLE